MIVNIDSYDKKLLYELDKNSKASLTELSKKLKRSKQFILYRMKKLEEAGVITGYHAIVDMSKLGYFTFRIYFKFQQMTEDDGKNFIKHIRDKLKNVWTITSMHGRWDYALFLGVKNILDFHIIWDDIMNSYKEKIKSYNVSIYSPIHNFNRVFFLEESKENIERIYGAGKEEKIYDKDLRLIEIYGDNVRQSLLDLSTKLKMAPETIHKRIKNLEKRKIIIGYKIGIDLKKLGYVSYRVNLNLISTKRNKELFDYCHYHKNIYQINDSIGGSDFEIEVVVQDLDHLTRLINGIKEKFIDVINDVEYFGFSTYHLLRYLPD